jgi:NUMOD4 motif/HNH endonuclease
MAAEIQEEWRVIQDFTRYAVSDRGQVKNLITDRILKQRNSTHGYHYVFLYRKDLKKNMRIHRLVAVAFLENLEALPVVDHLNGIKTDNRISNLNWVSQLENTRRAYAMGLYDKSIKKSSSPVNLVTSTGVFVKQFDSYSEAAQHLGIYRAGISNVILGKQHHTGGFYFETPMPN